MDTKQPMDEELRTMYAKVRAGVDPDTKQLHVTEEEFMQLIHQYGDTREAEGRIDELSRQRDYHIDSGYSGHHHDGFRMALNQVTDADNIRIAELKKTKEETQ